MTLGDGALLACAALLAGALNSIAGGGSFFSFPALVLTGLPPISANATSTVALWPGSLASAVGYRRELSAERERLAWLSLISFLGGAAGAVLLLLTPPPAFEALVPFLLLLATLVFSFGDRVRAHIPAVGSRGGVMAAWALISIYGGYFGGGMGLMMLAALALTGIPDIHRMNALKSALGVLVNGVAVAIFAVAGAVRWAPAALMVIGSIAGGYVGAALARRVDARRVRPVVVALGWVLTAVFFYRWLGV